MAHTQQNSTFRPGPPTGVLAKAIAFTLSAALVVLGFMFSLVALAGIALGGLLLGGWLWWKTRTLRRRMRAARAAQDVRPDNDVIEGEFVREAGPGPRLR